MDRTDTDTCTIRREHLSIFKGKINIWYNHLTFFVMDPNLTSSIGRFRMLLCRYNTILQRNLIQASSLKSNRV